MCTLNGLEWYHLSDVLFFQLFIVLYCWSRCCRFLLLLQILHYCFFFLVYLLYSGQHPKSYSMRSTKSVRPIFINHIKMASWNTLRVLLIINNLKCCDYILQLRCFVLVYFFWWPTFEMVQMQIFDCSTVRAYVRTYSIQDHMYAYIRSLFYERKKKTSKPNWVIKSVSLSLSLAQDTEHSWTRLDKMDRQKTHTIQRVL